MVECLASSQHRFDDFGSRNASSAQGVSNDARRWQGETPGSPPIRSSVWLPFVRGCDSRFVSHAGSRCGMPRDRPDGGCPCDGLACCAGPRAIEAFLIAVRHEATSKLQCFPHFHEVHRHILGCCSRRIPIRKVLFRKVPYRKVPYRMELRSMTGIWSSQDELRDNRVPGAFISLTKG